MNPYKTRPGFGLRVHRATEAIKKCGLWGELPAGRAFDNCFEAGDGSAVVWALVHTAKQEPDEFGQSLLTQGIRRMHSGRWPEQWETVYNAKEQPQ
jgi:hypothetical protein